MAGKTAEALSTESRASVLDVLGEMENRRGLDSLQNGWFAMFNDLSTIKRSSTIPL